MNNAWRALLLCALWGSLGTADRPKSNRRNRHNATDDSGFSNSSESAQSNGSPKYDSVATTGDISEHGTTLERFLKRHFHREDTGEQSIRNTFSAAKTEFCDWTRSPMSVLRGEVCGKYYKVLDLKRGVGEVLGADEDTIQKRIKRAYRTKSLSLHPDKNTERGAADAFKIVSEAYECLSDKSCRKAYDSNLQNMEMQIADWRSDMQLRVKKQLFFCVSEAHYYASLFAQNFYQCKCEHDGGVSQSLSNILCCNSVSTTVWKTSGKILFYDVPVGQMILVATMMARFRGLLLMHTVSYALLLFNIELAKNHRSFM